MSAPEDTLALHIRAHKLPEPVREYRFHPERQWRFDFAWPEQRLAVEVEGGIHTGGRHVRGTGYERDISKYNAATLMGWTLLRFSARMVRSGEAIKTIRQVLEERVRR